MSDNPYLKNINYKDLYLTIIKNKELFDSKLDEYWSRVAKWQTEEFGGKKIVCFSTLGTLEAWDKEDHAHPLNARTLVDGNELKKYSFAWYCGADLINSAKYFSKNDLKRDFEQRAWAIGKIEEYITNFRWGLDSLPDLADVISQKDPGWGIIRIGDRKDSINKQLKIDFINDVLPKGFSAYAFRNAHKVGGLKISSISNKMDFMVWRKFLNSKTMTQAHLKESLGVDHSSGFTAMVWSEIIKIDDVLDKKYFKETWRKTDIYSPINSSPEFALMILAKVNNGWAGQFYRVNLLENIDFKGSKISPLQFFSNKEVQYAIENTGWNNEKNGSNHFFTKDRFVEYLKDLWNI